MYLPKRYRTASAAAVALLTGVLLWPSAVGADPKRDKADHKGGHTGVGKVEVSSYVEERVEEQFIDHAPTGLSLGDQTVFSSTSQGRYGPAQGYGGCTFHRFDRTVGTVGVLCSGAAVDARGQLTFQGMATYDLAMNQPVGGEVTLAITGGTGAYAAAGGEVHFRQINRPGKLARFEGTIHLITK